MNDELVRELEFLRDIGYTHLDLGQAPAVQASTARRQKSLPSREPTSVEPVPPVAPYPEPGIPPKEAIVQQESLEELAELAAPCTRCPLALTRTRVVWAGGNPTAELMFIGEAPGRDEDEQGLPFVGRAGQLLTDIIQAMKLTRNDVYIANVIKCRPPDNRPPQPEELDACRPYIKRQIDFVTPRVIVTLGRFALQSTLENSVSIGAVRGTWQQYGTIPLMPTYHPAYLLRNPSAKKDVWNDMKKVMAELGG